MLIFLISIRGLGERKLYMKEEDKVENTKTGFKYKPKPCSFIFPKLWIVSTSYLVLLRSGELSTCSINRIIDFS